MTTQKLDEETLERVRKQGKMGDSFNQVLNRLLDKIDDLEEQLDDQREEISDQVESNDDELINGYQKRSDKVIKETVRKIENMFRGETDFAFAIDQIRRRLYALVYRATLKEQIKKA